MKRIIQNITGRTTATINFRGHKPFYIKPKHSMTLDTSKEEDKALYNHILQTYNFIIDITSKFQGGDKK